MPKPIEDVTSRLLPIEVQRSKDFPEYLLCRCPYEDCSSDGRPYLVHAKTWTRPIRRQSVNG